MVAFNMSVFFTVLSLSLALPAAIVSLCFTKKINGIIKIFIIFLNIVVLGLCIGTFVNGIIGYVESGYINNGYEVRYYRHPCAWVCLGLSCGSLVFAVISIIAAFTTIKVQRRNRVNESPNFVQTISTQNEVKTSSSRDYIEEIRALKELLDIGAITQEEFDAKKAKLLK